MEVRNKICGLVTSAFFVLSQWAQPPLDVLGGDRLCYTVTSRGAAPLLGTNHVVDANREVAGQHVGLYSPSAPSKTARPGYPAPPARAAGGAAAPSSSRPSPG